MFRGLRLSYTTSSHVIEGGTSTVRRGEEHREGRKGFT